MENKPLSPKRRFISTLFKFISALIFVTGTLVIWNVISNHELVQAVDQPTQTEVVVATLEPLPTLVPVIKVEITPSGVISNDQPSVLPVLREVTQPTVPPSVNNNTNNEPVILQSNPQPPVTTTNTSRP